MLIVTRKPGESVVIGNNVVVKIVGVSGEQVRLGIDAPKDISIFREELHEKIMNENRAAAFEKAGIDQFYKNWNRSTPISSVGKK